MIQPSGSVGHPRSNAWDRGCRGGYGDRACRARSARAPFQRSARPIAEKSTALVSSPRHRDRSAPSATVPSISSAPKRWAICAISRRHHDPVGFDVRDVVQHQPRYGNILQIVEARRLRNMVQRRVVGVKRQRDEGDESVRLILQLAQPDQVIDAILRGFNVTVEHGAVRFQPRLDGRCALHPATPGRRFCDRR